MAIDQHQGVNYFAYNMGNGGKYRVRMGVNRAAAGGFQPYTSGAGKLPIHAKQMRHAGWVSDDKLHRTQIPLADEPPANSVYRNGGSFTYEGVSGRIVSYTGEKIRAT